MVAAPRRGGHLHQGSPTAHTATQFRRELDVRRNSDAGRGRAGVVSNGGYPGYEVKRQWPEAAMGLDAFGFMAPCWKLLEMAQAEVNQVGT